MNSRQQELLKILETKKSASVHTLAKMLYASEPTIRRDLAVLENEGEIIRTHGGAEIKRFMQYNIHDSWEKSMFLFHQHHSEETIDRMARNALSLINDGDTIMLDSSVTAFAVSKYFQEKKGIVAFTSSLYTGISLLERGVKTFIIGGELHEKRVSTVGEDARLMISKYNADICFATAASVSSNGKVTEKAADENYVRMAMLESSKKSVLVISHERFRPEDLLTIGKIQDFDYVISDVPLPEELKELRRKYGKTAELI